MRREKKKCPSNVGPFQLLFYGDYFQVGNVTYILFSNAKKQENNSSLIRIVIVHCFSAIAKPLCFLRKANGFLSKLPLWRCSELLRLLVNGDMSLEFRLVDISVTIGPNEGAGTESCANLRSCHCHPSARQWENVTATGAHCKGPMTKLLVTSGERPFYCSCCCCWELCFGDAICLGSIDPNGPATQKTSARCRWCRTTTEKRAWCWLRRGGCFKGGIVVVHTMWPPCLFWRPLMGFLQ